MVAHGSGPPRLASPPPVNRSVAEFVRGAGFVQWDCALWRIQRQESLTHGRYPTPRYRFDAPGGEYDVLYTNDSWLGVFGEVYADRRGRRLFEEDGDYYLIRLLPFSSLLLLDLRSNKTLSALGLDARISTGDDYEACQSWALALHAALPDLAGLLYAPRKAGERFSNVALFTERCAEDLEYSPQGKLRHLENVALAAQEEYRLVVGFLG